MSETGYGVRQRPRYFRGSPDERPPPGMRGRRRPCETKGVLRLRCVRAQPTALVNRRMDKETGLIAHKARISACVLLTVVVAAGCARTQTREYAAIKPEPIYEELFPYYASICAVSQIRASFAKHGGTPGHAVMYLRGACRDESSDYPRLTLCPADVVESGAGDPGVGISVNKTFRNVNWMLIEGRRLFFDGNIEPGTTLSKENGSAVLDAAIESRLWKGIEIHDEYKPPSDSDQDWRYLVASETLATDFALRFGRHVYCARMPMPRERLGGVIDYLNGLNDEYARGEADYNWSGYSDNCAHTLHNALAAADVWKEQSIRVTKLRQLFNISVPANEFANLAIRGNRFPIEDLRRIYRDKDLRRSLMENNWLPARHGAMLKYLPVHHPNEVYDTQARIFVLEMPLLRSKSRTVSEMFDDARYTQVGDNLRFWEQRYEEILAKRPQNWDRAGERDEYGQFRKRYYEYIAEQLEEVQQMLARVGMQKTTAAMN